MDEKRLIVTSFYEPLGSAFPSPKRKESFVFCFRSPNPEENVTALGGYDMLVRGFPDARRAGYKLVINEWSESNRDRGTVRPEHAVAFRDVWEAAA